MASAPQGFRSRVKDRVTNERRTVTFFLETTDEDEDGKEFVVRRDDFTAVAPTEEQLMLILAQGGRDDANVADEMASILDLFKITLSAREHRVLMKRLKDPEDLEVTMETLVDIFEWLMEQWQDFPTQPPSGSSTSQGSTGTKSTGRVRGKGSTR